MYRYLFIFLVIPFLAQANVPLNRIVATVNDDVIMQSELNNRIAMVTSQLQEQHAQLPSAEALKKQVLERPARPASVSTTTP
jgi:peptidyl-prolyl cis-trans isomerase SurA